MLSLRGVSMLGTRLLRRDWGLANAISTIVSLILAGLVATAPVAEANRVRPTFWGMSNTDWSNWPTIPVYGFNLTTNYTRWQYIEVEPGEYDFNALDDLLELAESRRAKPLLILGGTPDFHGKDPGLGRASVPDMSAWRRYVRIVANRYGARLDYQIWPEPGIVQNWAGTPRQMAKITAVASTITQQIAPRAKIVSGATPLRLKSQREWFRKFFNSTVFGKPVRAYVDIVAIDPYPEMKGNPEDARELMLWAKRKLRQWKVNKPIWVNEINYGIKGGFDSTQYRLSKKMQAAYVTRTYVLAAAAGMKRVDWFGWFYFHEYAVHMLDKEGNVARPAKALDAVHGWLNKTNVKKCRKGHRQLWTCLVKKGTQVRRIYWSETGRTLSVRTHRTTESWETMLGQRTKRRGSYRLSVDAAPVMVTSRR